METAWSPLRVTAVSSQTHPSLIHMSSPFSSKLWTNYCPTDTERAEIKALIVERAARMKHLDAEITRMQKTLDNLTRERTSIAASIAGHEALISLARRLPHDITQEIFKACIPTDRNCAVSASEAPLLLCQICGAWRAIALSTPSLWASLHLVPAGAPPARPLPSQLWPSFSFDTILKKLPQQAESTKEWLGRSGACPLSISIDFFIPFWNAPEALYATFRTLLQAALFFSSRWQRIEFRIPESEITVLDELTAADVPILRSLSLNHISREGFTGQRSLDGRNWGSFQVLYAPSLSSIKIATPELAGNLLGLPLRWNHLRAVSFSAGMIASQVMLEVIARCPQLRQYYCAFMHSEHEPFATSLPVQSTSLRALALRPIAVLFAATGAAPLPFFPFIVLNHLALSELRTFVLYGLPASQMDMRYAPVQPVLAITQFFSISSRLETLYLHGNSISKITLLNILHALPSTVQHFMFHDILPHHNIPSPLDDEVLAAITPTSDHPVICPALKTFAVRRSTGISDSALLQFLSARMATSSSLKLVQISFEREREIDIRPKFPLFTAAGLDISLTYLSQLSSSLLDVHPDLPNLTGFGDELWKEVDEF